MTSLKMQQLKSFFTFDSPVNYYNIYKQFSQTHNQQRRLYANWPPEATRHQLINEYWNNTIWHYLLLIGISVVSVFPFSGDPTAFLFSTVLLSIVLYLFLHYTVYRRVFSREFMPKLETAIATYEDRERSQLEKCKQDQLSNRALVLLYYVFDKTSKANYLAPSDKCADLLHKLYGVSPKGIKNELDLIYKKDKRAKLESRHIVEVSKSFEEAYKVLETMQFEDGIKCLKSLEQQFPRP
ncbi:hypothetical protein CLV59_10615 [Chitinophaga dinghuensis]|uniref:Uncharacterized protein n=1 Tax=Chitinophaga dinghuensis TaxID=1539050 RepID=A0A327VVH9_9BACT|nr:hypothetical protein [Chitinophaga dinghuensis]RAJ78955.1 hypothetical protein CLV59_10615 [Chitinophaga dinghuensis]